MVSVTISKAKVGELTFQSKKETHTSEKVTDKHTKRICTQYKYQIQEFDQIKQFKEFLGTYNKFPATCFLGCVKDPTTRGIKPEETNEALAPKAGLLGQP
ncbi:mitochondrial import inner membrane translocase subunit Tim9-like [Puma concolor]|uniref:Mitochondrial import inner membrane translocase subunit Tim9-like n=1 Tax=Puma concolor TaxID=9696 RepID=A0A6P6H3N2_PUMCO|nr:mitochondrial import inner membrane translocase subunit Tim9-like [Puma concolor]